MSVILAYETWHQQEQQSDYRYTVFFLSQQKKIKQPCVFGSINCRIYEVHLKAPWKANPQWAVHSDVGAQIIA